MILKQALSFLSIICFATTACSTQTADTYELISHCDMYKDYRSLSEILDTADAAYLAQKFSDQNDAVLRPVRFAVEASYFGEVPSEVELLSASPSDPVAASEYVSLRQKSHVSPSFFWTYASKPNAYGYSGTDSSNCNLIPIALSEQSYIVVVESGKITLFEPVPDGPSALKTWLEYYAKEVFPFRTQQ